MTERESLWKFRHRKWIIGRFVYRHGPDLHIGPLHILRFGGKTYFCVHLFGWTWWP